MDSKFAYQLLHLWQPNVILISFSLQLANPSLWRHMPVTCTILLNQNLLLFFWFSSWRSVIGTKEIVNIPARYVPGIFQTTLIGLHTEDFSESSLWGICFDQEDKNVFSVVECYISLNLHIELWKKKLSLLTCISRWYFPSHTPSFYVFYWMRI